MWIKTLAFAAAISLLAAANPSTRAADDAEVTLQGSLVCNGACIPNPKNDDHVMVLFAIDGTPEVRAQLATIMATYPPKGLDADSAVKLMEQFDTHLKYYISPDSPALPPAKKPPNHYCNPAAASSVTGTLVIKDGKKWLTARKITAAKLTYPAPMLAPDQPFAKPTTDPIVLPITDKLTLTCVPIPPGKFLMGTPVYMWPYFQEEYPHVVTLTKSFYLSDTPITQALYEAVMGANPSAIKDPQLPVENPTFADVEKFCQRLSEKTGRHVRLPTDAEWEYAARVGTSNPAFREKYHDQDSSGKEGFKSVLPVKSQHSNAWGLYDLPSCWWEITGDKGMYNVRHPETDPAYPPAKPETAHSQRNGRGLIKEGWSLVTHEFITEKGYAGQKFRIVVEAPTPASAPGKKELAR